MKDFIALIPVFLAELRSAWRFRWYGAALAWAICVIGWTVTAILPDVYEASAKVYVDTSSVLRPILSNQIVPNDIVAELTYVRQSLLGRQHLERVARENGLDAEAKTPEQLNVVLNKLLRGINIETQSVSNQPGNVVATLKYRNPKRDTAIGVVSTLLNSLVQGTLGATKEGTDTAGKFLEDRIAEYEQRLQKAEQALADFKRQNSDRLPGAEGGYFERMRAERTALEAAQKSLRIAESKAAQLRAQLNSSSPVLPTGTLATQPPPNSLDARIRDYRAQLDKLLLDFTDKHPDVIATRQALENLERQRAEQLRALGAANTDQEISSLGANPVHQAVQIALNGAEVDIATLQADIQDRTKKLTYLQSLVDEVPQVEAELATLNRDYDVVRQQYQALIRSRETQDLSEKAAAADQVEFRELDPPLAEFEPVAPHRAIYLTGVFLLALIGGAALCSLLAMLRPVFTTPNLLRDIVGLPVVGVVGLVFEQQHRVRRLFNMLTFSSVMGGLTMLFLLALAFELKGRGIHSLVSMIS